VRHDGGAEQDDDDRGKLDVNYGAHATQSFHLDRGDLTGIYRAAPGKNSMVGTIDSSATRMRCKKPAERIDAPPPLAGEGISAGASLSFG